MFKIIKDIKTFLYYKNVLKQHETELFNRFKLRLDHVGRLYTIFNISPDDYKAYGDELLESELKKYISSVDKFLIKIKLADMYGLSNKEMISENNYKIVIRFKPVDMATIANFAVILGITLISSFIIGLAIFLALI